MSPEQSSAPTAKVERTRICLDQRIASIVQREAALIPVPQYVLFVTLAISMIMEPVQNVLPEHIARATATVILVPSGSFQVSAALRVVSRAQLELIIPLLVQRLVLPVKRAHSPMS